MLRNYFSIGPGQNYVLTSYMQTRKVHNQRFSTWGEKGGEIVKDLRVPLPSCEADHRAYVQREGPQLLPRAQTIHLQHILHVVEETHE